MSQRKGLNRNSTHFKLSENKNRIYQNLLDIVKAVFRVKIIVHVRRVECSQINTLGNYN